ncbi:hypothetical protein [Mastigocoleus testarum]|nr:hypothetical protein [Mastigocoleus testarum]
MNTKDKSELKLAYQTTAEIASAIAIVLSAVKEYQSMEEFINNFFIDSNN